MRCPCKRKPKWEELFGFLSFHWFVLPKGQAGEGGCPNGCGIILCQHRLHRFMAYSAQEAQAAPAFTRSFFLDAFRFCIFTCGQKLPVTLRHPPAPRLQQKPGSPPNVCTGLMSDPSEDLQFPPGNDWWNAVHVPLLNISPCTLPIRFTPPSFADCHLIGGCGMVRKGIEMIIVNPGRHRLSPCLMAHKSCKLAGTNASAES